MKTISDYLSTMFINLPESPELIQLKMDLLANMEDRYEELITVGKNEHTAIGTVISEFGNIDELLAELEIDVTSNSKEGELPLVSLTESLDYLATKRKVGLGVGLGVMLCCLGGAALFSLISLSLMSDVRMPLLLTATVLALSVTAGVILFIVNGYRNQRYKYLHRDFIITGSTRSRIEEEKQAYERSYILGITIGVGICIIALFPLLYTSIVYSESETLVLFGLAGSALIAGLGTFFFVYSGNMMLGFNTILHHGKLVQPGPRRKKRQKIERIFANVYWPTVTILFFIFGLSDWGWGFGRSWLIFPIAGIFESVVKKFFE